MKTQKRMRMVAFCLFAAVLLFGQERAEARERMRTWRVPVLMEASTARGKVVVLETRKEDRKAVENLLVQVWTAPDEEQEVEGAEEAEGKAGEETPPEKGNPESPQEEEKLVHETRTDENGLFSLPVLSVGAYRLVIGELSVQLRVLPKAEERKDQEEPKILLILLPKEVVN